MLFFHVSCIFDYLFSHWWMKFSNSERFWFISSHHFIKNQHHYLNLNLCLSFRSMAYSALHIHILFHFFIIIIVPAVSSAQTTAKTRISRQSWHSWHFPNIVASVTVCWYSLHSNLSNWQSYLYLDVLEFYEAFNISYQNVLFLCWFHSFFCLGYFYVYGYFR